MAATATGNRAMVAETHSADNGRVLRYALLPSHELTAAGSLGSLDVRWFEGIRRTRLWFRRLLGPVEQVPSNCAMRARNRCGPAEYLVNEFFSVCTSRQLQTEIAVTFDWGFTQRTSS